MSTHSHHDESAGHHFVAPISYYVGTFLALIFLTVLTVAVTAVDLGQLNIVVALAIAVVKASLVVAFFMGLAWDSDSFNKVVFGCALLFLSLFFLLTFPDLLFRDAIDPVRGNACTNPAAYCAKAPTTTLPTDVGHADPEHNPRRLYYGAGSSTGAAPSTSGVLINSSASGVLPGGEDFGKPPMSTGEVDTAEH